MHLAYIASLLRVTDEVLLSEIAQYGPHSFLNALPAFKGSIFYNIIAVTAADVVP